MESSMEDLLARHRKEQQDLQNRINGMKKQATKARRREVNSKCQSLQDELSDRHRQEIDELNSKLGGVTLEEGEEEVTPEQLLAQLEGEKRKEKPEKMETVPDSTESGTVAGAPQQQQKRHRNRQRERLARREAEIAKIKAEAALEASQQPNLQKVEQDAIDNLCTLKHLKQIDIKPDGHCLFASVLDQLKLRHSAINASVADYDVNKLRSMACDYVRSHRDDFLPYLFDETTMNLRDIDEYTKEMETTAKWGGEIEIMALSKVFDCPISILFSDRPVQIYNEDGKNPELKLVYYKHSYTLGEHYNSLHDDDT